MHLDVLPLRYSADGPAQRCALRAADAGRELLVDRLRPAAWTSS